MMMMMMMMMMMIPPGRGALPPKAGCGRQIVTWFSGRDPTQGVLPPKTSPSGGLVPPPCPGLQG
eukprot:8567241-Karenia_brevis.AAC.1